MNSQITNVEAAEIISNLKSGQIVTLPTETVEGYAVRLSDMQAIKDLMRLKDRDYDSGKIFTLVPTSPQEIDRYAIIPPAAQSIINQHIPGELTIVLPKTLSFHHPYYDHYSTIGIRIPDHSLFAEILPQVGPLILTSANPRGGTPKSTTGHPPSTIVDFTTDPPQILRQGGLYLDL
ncbi:Sua5/YciO/YrdC/YwlC family protein [Candidatus Saccharibacteria bacterium]|nr:Sua5/YciO/YrdC/YwlC family protein [Candidatus Saccharibacteria bacterium]